jgi:hypothetical protein
MIIESSDIVEQSAEEVYRIVRDQMQLIVPYMPNIEKIEQVEREDRQGGPRIVNHWTAKSQLPAIASRFVSPEILSWVDRARWNDATYSVEYEIEGKWRPDLYTCRGLNSFRPDGAGRTEVRVSVELRIHGDRLPGIPKLLAGRVVPAVEEFVRRLMQPNLTSLAKGLQAYLREREA